MLAEPAENFWSLRRRHIQMVVLCLVLAAALPQVVAAADSFPVGSAPFYTLDSVAHAATNQAGALAPNTIASLYGVNLSWETVAVKELKYGSQLPVTLPNAGVHVMVGGILAPLYYVSPTQVNFLTPAMLVPGRYDLELVRDGRSGPSVSVVIAPAAPGLFSSRGWALATRASGEVVDPASPAIPGEAVVLYGTGFGQTNPSLTDGLIARTPARIPAGAEIKVMLNDVDVSERVFYVGVTPGYAGLYQVNLRVPENVPPDPQVVISIRGAASPPGVRLAVQRPGNSPQP